MAAKSDYYDILGIAKGASAEEIKKAYRKQALEWHPDRHKDDKEEAEKRFKEINEAYQILSDPQKRSAYDQFGHSAFAPGGAAYGGGFPGAGGPFGQGQQGRWGPFTYTYTTSGGGSPFSSYDFGDPFDIFEQFFGFDSPFRQARKPRYSISIDFMEAMNGVEKTVEIEGKKRKIRIPPGVDEGSRIQFDDFILSVNVHTHDIFEREGDDIFVKVFIPFSLAGLGGTTEVPSIDGPIKIRVRPGTQSDTVMRLRGKGAPRVHGRGRGDEYVRINIAVPDGLSREQKDLLEKLQKEGF